MISHPLTLQLRVELAKLRTTRLPYGLLAAAVGLSALFSALAAGRAGSSGIRAAPLPPLSTAAGLTTVTTTTGFALLMAALLGVTLATGEYRYGTATLTYLGCPDRTRVLVAKAGAGAVAGAVLGLSGGAAATLSGLAFAAAAGDPVKVGPGALAGHIAGAAVAAALLGAAGTGLGSLLRSQLGAVIGLFTWALIGETLVGGLYTTVRPYLPYSAATTLGGTQLGQAALGFVRTAPGTGPLPFAGSAAIVLGVVLLLGVVAAVTTLRRDIT